MGKYIKRTFIMHCDNMLHCHFRCLHLVMLDESILMITLTFLSCLDFDLMCCFGLLVPRPHLSFEAQLVAGKSHELGPISCPNIPNPPPIPSGVAFGKQKHEAELKYPQRIRRLNIFPPSKIEVCLLLSRSFFVQKSADYFLQ